MQAVRYIALLMMVLVLGGCASFGRGVAEALLEAQYKEREDVRACNVDGASFTGISPMMDRQAAHGPLAADNPDRPTLKVVYVHGIGDHQPGHGGNLIRLLAKTLGLGVRASRVKRIVLAAPDDSERAYGEVNIVRMVDASRSRELLFFEHTWNPITLTEKASIAFDSAVVYSADRAAVNQQIRSFSNSVFPDPLAFAGSRGEDIRGSVGQALCWAMSARWADLEDKTSGMRCQAFEGYGDRIGVDDVVIVTHSLGSRATVDALQTAARAAVDNAAVSDPSRPVSDKMAMEVGRGFADKLRMIELTLYMLSNQLPLLEAGQPPQAITGAYDIYCGDGAPRANERFLKQLNMVAFTDPNDMLSFPVPTAWADQYLESRLCANIRNVTINIAHVRSLPILGEYADPLRAHVGYDEDERVGHLMAYGIGHDRTDPLITERCLWVDVDRSLD